MRPANIFKDAFADCDVALLSHVIQGFERDRARELINHIYGWLPSGAELLLHTHLPERAQTPFPFLFGLILQINNTQGGEARTTRNSRAAGCERPGSAASRSALSPRSPH